MASEEQRAFYRERSRKWRAANPERQREYDKRSAERQKGSRRKGARPYTEVMRENALLYEFLCNVMGTDLVNEILEDARAAARPQGRQSA